MKENLRRYEFVYLVQPEAEEETRARVASRINEILESAEARQLKREEWGKRKLAYEIQKFNKAYYFNLEFISRPGTTHEIERVLGLLDDCIRFQTIKLEEGITEDDFDRFPLLGEDAPAEEAEEAKASAEAEAPAVAEAPAAVEAPAEVEAAEEEKPAETVEGASDE